MSALLDGPGHNTSRGDQYLHRWLAHGQATIAAFHNGRHPVARSGAQAGCSTIDQLSIINVAVQADTLAAHPVVALAREQRQLEVIGLFYDIYNAEVLLVTPSDVATLTNAHHGA